MIRDKHVGMTNDDPIIQAARDRLAEINLERRELESFIETYRKLSARVVVLEPRSIETHSPVASQPTLHEASTTAEILSATREILLENGKPTAFADLYDALMKRGIVIPGREPRANLSQKLSSSDQFTGRRGIGWWFAGQWPDEQPPAPEKYDGPE